MAKTKISENYDFLFKEKKFIELNGELYEDYEPLEWLLNENNILDSLAESIEKKDLKAVLETVSTYQFARRTARKIAKARAEEASSNSSNSEGDSGHEYSTPVYSFSSNSRTKS